MGNFEFNSIEDLVFSRSFRNWVLNKNSPDAGFWENWIPRNPGKAEMIRHAKAFIYALHVNPLTLSEEDIETEVQKALRRLRDAPRDFTDDSPALGHRRSMSYRLRGYRVLAAAILLSGVCLAGFFFYKAKSGKQHNVLQSFLASRRVSPVRLQTAGAFAEQIISLSDGSTARLGKASKLYCSESDTGKREVFLDGEAFFDIRKNAARPFYVYTAQVVAKVLGTSFLVRAISADPTTTITVRTGKVSVYREDDFYAQPAVDEPGGIILTPNQEVVYNRDLHQLNKLLTEKPEKLPGARDTTLVFNRTPVSRLFERLQELYGIPIIYDEEVVSSCSLNVTMGNESFYVKLNMICKVIGASYEVIDGNIVVTAPGCKIN